MKSVLLLLLGLLLVGGIVFLLLNRFRANPSNLDLARVPSEKQTPPDPAYLTLRNGVFQGVRQHASRPPGLPEDYPLAVVMDWKVDGTVVTVLGVVDGSASLYYSTGGGNLGGGAANKEIAAAAKNAASIASHHLKDLKKVTDFPIPLRDRQVFFYILTDKNVYFSEGTQGDLQAGQHPLSDLGNAMQLIVTGYRLNQ